MTDLGSSEIQGEHEDVGTRLDSMPKSKLEALAVSVILEHRRVLAADEAIYEEWSRAAADSSVPHSVLARLLEEYLTRQKKSEAQQEELSGIIEALGYVPDVPPAAMNEV